ncbi:MAG: extracellular solute-binding protein [Anaerolineales bacterium]|nr:extracellular solute-binding protein [Anaerolineales bacterium]
MSEVFSKTWPIRAIGLVSSVLFFGLGCSVIGGNLVSQDTIAATPAETVAETPSSSPNPANIPSATLPSETILWWHFTTDSTQKLALEMAALKFMEMNPSVTIQISSMERDAYKSRILGALESEDAPDLFQNDGDFAARNFAKSGYLQNISPSMTDAWRSTFVPSVLEPYNLNGRQYGAPCSFSMIGVWYNKAHFLRAGIDTLPTTWSEFLEDVRKLKSAGIVPIALGEGDKWSGALWWEYLALRLGGRAAFEEAVSGTGAFTTNSFVQAGERLTALISAHPFQAGFLNLPTYPDASAEFGNGKTAIHLMGDWESENQKANSSDGKGLGSNLGWFPFPVVENGNGDSKDILGGVTGWLVGKNAPPLTIEFLKFLTSKEIVCRLAVPGSMPAVLDAGDCLGDPFPKSVWETAVQAKYIQTYYDQYLPAAAASATNEAIYGLFAGTISPAQAAQLIDDSFA